MQLSPLPHRSTLTALFSPRQLEEHNGDIVSMALTHWPTDDDGVYHHGLDRFAITDGDELFILQNDEEAAVRRLNYHGNVQFEYPIGEHVTITPSKIGLVADNLQNRGVNDVVVDAWRDLAKTNKSTRFYVIHESKDQTSGPLEHRQIPGEGYDFAIMGKDLFWNRGYYELFEPESRTLFIAPMDVINTVAKPAKNPHGLEYSLMLAHPNKITT